MATPSKHYIECFMIFSQVLHLCSKTACKNPCWVAIQIQKCFFSLFSFQELWWFFKAEIANRRLFYSRQVYKPVWYYYLQLLNANWWNIWPHCSKTWAHGVSYHVVCSMSWTPSIKPGNLLTILATIYIRTVSSLHLLNWFKLFLSCLNWATFTVSSISARPARNKSNVPELKRLTSS